MIELLEKQLADFISFVKQGGGFIKEQAPLYVQELLNQEIYSLKFGLTLTSILVLLAIAITIICNRKYRKNNLEPEWLAPVTVMLVLFSIAFSACAISYFFELKKIEIAPRVFVLDKLIGKARGVKP
jgi:hypothetical protein